MENEALQNWALVAGLVCIIALWVSARYLILEKPLTFWDKATCLIMGVAAGRGLARLWFWRFPTLDQMLDNPLPAAMMSLEIFAAIFVVVSVVGGMGARIHGYTNKE